MRKASVIVRILDAPFAADAEYSYLLPEQLADSVEVGSFVTVPFGRGDRRHIAVVVGGSDDAEYAASGGRKKELKPVLSVTQERFALNEEQLGLCSFLCSTTICTFGDAVRTVLPGAAFSSLKETWKACADEYTGETSEDALVFGFLRSNGITPLTALLREFGPAVQDSLRRLRKAGLAAADYEVSESSNTRTLRYYTLNVTESEASDIASGVSHLLRSAKQRAIVGYILNSGKAGEDELRRQLDATRKQLLNLCARNIITEHSEEYFRDPYSLRGNREPDENVLSDEQKNAFLELESLYKSGEARTALLYGITGSGKTRVIKAMVDRVLKDGRKVIILVPEISLTPQTVDFFCGYYGDRVSVIHSSLSAGERFDAYRKIASGGTDVVIGTRSAVFAPLKNIGMIVIDEEQEHTYKSDTSPKYHARDVARYRVSENKALLLMASATPSLDSFYRAKQGKYCLVSLKNRYGNAKLPDIRVVNMCREASAGNLSPLSGEMMAAIGNAGKEGHQSILFLNRRGYSNFEMCRMCGEVIECPNCSVSLTFHAKPGVRVGEDAASRSGKGYLICHYCGYRQEIPVLCPSCGSDHMAFIGYGTQMVERELNSLFPSAGVLRMDNDTTGAKFSYEDMLGRFKRGESDILLGTQMVAKGHDFPNVTLVGVIDADSMLHYGDYRAGERTFSMITQVVGRAGRGDHPGEAIIQTHMPDNEIISLACSQDYEAFYEKEIAVRKSYLFPPFCDMVLITFTGTDEAELNGAVGPAAEAVSKMVRTEFTDTPVIAYGPFEAPVYKMDEKFRIRMVFKCRLGKRTRELLSKIMKELPQSLPRTVSISMDINPSSI